MENMVESVNMVAFFPGKFQPPHLGHVLTVMRIYEDYDKIIICVTEDKPRAITVEKTKNIFKEAFQHLSKVEIVSINEVLCSMTTLEKLPNFDVLLTGNPDVIHWSEEHNVECKFLDRSIGPGFSGTTVRKGLDL